MEDGKKTLRLSDHEGVDRLNSLDQFLRQYENDAIVIDVSGKDFVPTPVLQTLICASMHWSQRDLEFFIVGAHETMKQNFELVGADLQQFIQEEAAG